MYHDKEFSFTVKPEPNKFNDVKLSPAFGQLSITSFPTGAEVWMGDNKVGVTPYRAEKIKSGQHMVTLKYPLYLPVSNQVIVVQDGKETKQNYTLSENYGTLKIASNPSHGEVVVVTVSNAAKNEMEAVRDRAKRAFGETVAPIETSNTEVAKGETPFKYDLEPGNYKVRLKKSGYAPIDFNISVALGKTTEINEKTAILRRLEGKITVTTEPYDPTAEVFVDGVKVGGAPLDVVATAGTHEVSVKTATQEGKASIKIEDRKIQTVKITLQESAEIALWNRIENSRDYTDFEEYLQKYPGGLFSKLANKQIKQLKEDAEKARKKQEEFSRDQEKAAKEARIKERLDKVQFFFLTRSAFEDAYGKNSKNKNSFTANVTMFPTFLGIEIYMLAVDIIMLPTVSTVYINAYTEAALRPSEWAKPDSMIAKAHRRLDFEVAKAKNSKFAIANR
jgi:hypothetical protein